MCTVFGYACRIYFVAIWVIIQSIIHLSVIVICFQVFWCYVLPKPSQIVPMFGYMAYFYKIECMNLTQVGFPPNWTSPPSDYFKWLYSRSKGKSHGPQRSGYKNTLPKLSNLNGSYIDPNSFKAEYQKPARTNRNDTKARWLMPTIPAWLKPTLPSWLIPTVPPWLSRPPWLTRPPFMHLPGWPSWLPYPSWMPGWPSWLGGGEQMPTPILWPRRARSIAQNYRWIITYMIMDSMWILATILLIIAALIRIRGLMSLFFYMPWILVTIAICITDVIAAGYFGVTIAYTSTWYDFLHFMGVRNMDEVRDETKIWFSDYHGQFTTPAIIATLFFSRLGIIWLLNIIFLFIIIHIFRRVMHQKIIHKRIIMDGPPAVMPAIIPAPPIEPLPPPLPVETNSTDCLGCVPPGLQPKPLLDDIQPTQTVATARPKSFFDYLLECC